MDKTVAERYGSSHHLANQPATNVREGSVSAEIRDLHSQLQALDDATGKLRGRLEKVVLNRPTDCQNDCAENPVARCEVAVEIHAAVDLVCNITAKVTAILCGLEL